MNKEELYEEIAKQKIEMTPNERMAAYAAGEEVDCIPHGILSADDALGVAWGMQKLDLYNKPEVRAAQLKRALQDYDAASIDLALGLRGLGVALGSEESVSPHDENHIEKHFLTDYSMLDRLENFDPATNEYIQKRVNFALEVQALAPEIPLAPGVTGPISAAIAMRPVEKLLKDTRRDPETAHRFLDLVTECNLKYARYLYDRFGLTNWFVADPVSTTDILGHKGFVEFSKPYLKKMLDGIVEITGAMPGAHICGHTKGIWLDLAEIGVTTFSVDNCEDMNDFRAIAGDKMFLMGNVSPVTVMYLGSIDDVIEGVKDSIRRGAENPCGFMLNTGCQVVMGTPIENVDAFFYAARKYGAGAKFGCMPKGMANA